MKDERIANEVVSALDWAAAFVREQSRKASDATFASALESVAAKVADMSQGVKNAFSELALARAGNGGVESASQKKVLARAGKRRRDKGE